MPSSIIIGNFKLIKLIHSAYTFVNNYKVFATQPMTGPHVDDNAEHVFKLSSQTRFAGQGLVNTPLGAHVI